MRVEGNILVVGSSGQIGTELVAELRRRNKNVQVVASDIKPSLNSLQVEGPFEELDILDAKRLREIVEKYQVVEIYQLAALLSGTAEKNPEYAWKLNMDGLFHVLDLAKEGIIKKVFWPSSIAVFGPNTAKNNTPQSTIMRPTSVYGIGKLAGESWCEYYKANYGVDVRGIRYPGLISYKSKPGGGTTDYAVEIFYEALSKGRYTSFLNQETELPMMYMPDAIEATIQLMDAPVESLSQVAYNLTGFSFTPAQLGAEIRDVLPDFELDYAPDFRQKIANSWPSSIDDSVAQQDWGWMAKYSLEDMVKDMIKNISAQMAAR